MSMLDAIHNSLVNSILEEKVLYMTPDLRLGEIWGRGQYWQRC